MGKGLLAMPPPQLTGLRPSRTLLGNVLAGGGGRKSAKGRGDLLLVAPFLIGVGNEVASGLGVIVVLGRRKDEGRQVAWKARGGRNNRLRKDNPISAAEKRGRKRVDPPPQWLRRLLKAKMPNEV